MGLTLLVGIANGALASGAARAWYLSIERPPGAAPSAAFGPIWAATYVCSGIGGWLAWKRAGAVRALRIWGWHLAATAARTAAFFGLHNPVLAAAVGLVALGLAIAVIRGFRVLHRGAAWLMVPSLLWAGYVLYLDTGFWLLNPH